MKNIPTAKNNIKRLAEIKYSIPEKNLKVTYHFSYYYYYYYLIFFFLLWRRILSFDFHSWYHANGHFISSCKNLAQHKFRLPYIPPQFIILADLDWIFFSDIPVIITAIITEIAYTSPNNIWPTVVWYCIVNMFSIYIGTALSYI